VPVETSLSPPFAVFWLLLLSFLFRIWVCVCVCDVCGGCVTVKQFWFGLVSLCSEMVVLMLFMLLLFCNLRKEVRVWQTPFLSFFFCYLLFFVELTNLFFVDSALLLLLYLFAIFNFF
jgi:hypothetical protein